ncbi:hypothetical protein M9458_014121, partial [Cirrhinus mrigala]
MCRPHLIHTQGLSILDNSNTTAHGPSATWAKRFCIQQAPKTQTTCTRAPVRLAQLYCLPPTPPKDADAGKYHLHLVDGMKMECTSPIRGNLAQTTTPVPSYSDYALSGAHDYPGSV